MHQQRLNAEETHAEHNGTDDSEEKRLVFLVIWRFEQLEDAVKDKQVVNGEHPFQEIPCTKRKSRGIMSDESASNEGDKQKMGLNLLKHNHDRSTKTNNKQHMVYRRNTIQLKNTIAYRQ